MGDPVLPTPQEAGFRPRPWMAPTWTKGQSGNPNGAGIVVRTFAKEIRNRSGKGDELLAYLFENLRNPRCHALIRFKSAELLIRYGWGEPPKDTGDPLGIDLSRLTPDELATLKAIHAKATTQPNASQAAIPKAIDTTATSSTSAIVQGDKASAITPPAGISPMPQVPPVAEGSLGPVASPQT